MTNIFFCGNCGKFGDMSTLDFGEEKNEGLMSSIIKKNNLVRFICPDCKSDLIYFTKPQPTTQVNMPNVQWWPRTLPPIENGNISINPIDVTPKIICKDELPSTIVQPNRLPIQIFTCHCDLCDKDFTSKVDRSTRCGPCLNKLVKGK